MLDLFDLLQKEKERILDYGYQVREGIYQLDEGNNISLLSERSNGIWCIKTAVKPEHDRLKPVAQYMFNDQEVLDVLTGPAYRFGLNKMFNKMKGKNEQAAQ